MISFIHPTSRQSMIYLFALVLGVTLHANNTESEFPTFAPETFAQQPFQLGHNASKQSELTDGRAFGQDKPGKASAAWDLSNLLTDGRVYLIECRVDLVGTEENPKPQSKVSLRFGTDANLERKGKERFLIVSEKNVEETSNYSRYHVFEKKMPFFGALGFNLPDGVDVQIRDLKIQEVHTPWSVIPSKKEKTFYVNDVYVAPKTLRSEPIPIPPGATQAHVKLTYAPEKIASTAAVRARVSHNNARGFDHSKGIAAPEETFVWRDGDDRDMWVTFDILKPSYEPGDRFRASVDGAGVGGWIGFDFIVEEGAVNELPSELPYHRPPYQLVLPDEPTKDLDITTVEWDESGFKDGRPVWVTHPAYIYTQPGNAETGAYLPWTAMNAPGVNPHSLERDAEGRPYVRLHTRKLDEPIKLKHGKEIPHQASMLQAQNLDEWCHRRGIYSAQFVLPSRRGAWSAFWACGRHPTKKRPMWPPEIDFLESFNGAYGADYHPDTTSAGQHAGLHGSVRREVADGFELDIKELGFAPDFDFNTQIHDITTVIEDEWITHFRDGIEFFRHRNIVEPEDGNTEFDFYPIVNVAVKDNSGGEYNEGTGDMRWYGLQYYAADSGYELVPYTQSKPYPNGEILPRPSDLQ
ncbi:MAG: hypothetical protein ACQKBV_05380 [Puniceicoccales bacterium]